MRVLEKSGTRSLRQWDRVATRVLPQRGGTVMSGILLAYDQETSEQLPTSLRRVRSKAGGLVAEGLKGARPDRVSRRSRRSRRSAPPELLLVRTAFASTNLRRAAALRAELNNSPPEVANSDSDPLQFVTLHFSLRLGVTRASLRAALEGVPVLERAGPSFWNWPVSPAKQPKRVPRKPDGVQLITTMEGGTPVLGTVEIAGRKVILSVNPEAQSERGPALLEPAFQGLVRPPLVERQDPDHLLEEKRANGERPPSPDLPPRKYEPSFSRKWRNTTARFSTNSSPRWATSRRARQPAQRRDGRRW